MCLKCCVSVPEVDLEATGSSEEAQTTLNRLCDPKQAATVTCAAVQWVCAATNDGMKVAIF